MGLRLESGFPERMRKREGKGLPIYLFIYNEEGIKSFSFYFVKKNKKYSFF
jgi:hypothetical protein